jgi:hypothetical protein
MYIHIYIFNIDALEFLYIYKYIHKYICMYTYIDALEFLLHDLKHMENFTDKATYNEQVGFSRCMLKLSNVVVETHIFIYTYETYIYIYIHIYAYIPIYIHIKIFMTNRWDSFVVC